jgi:hypothetical protein
MKMSVKKKWLSYILPRFECSEANTEMTENDTIFGSVGHFSKNLHFVELSHFSSMF